MPNFEAALARLDDYVARQLRARNTPGLTLGVTDRQRLLAARSYGFANVDARRPVTPETLFETGSIGKSFTSIALMQLREEGCRPTSADHRLSAVVRSADALRADLVPSPVEPHGWPDRRQRFLARPAL